MGKVMVVSGEVSGEIQAARVIREIKKKVADTIFFGMGSRILKKEGVDIIVDPSEYSTIGFTEALKNIKVHLGHLKILKAHIKERKPDVIFLIDYSGFNMLMARLAYKKRIPAVDYFPPSAWVWGKWRAGWMARYNPRIAAVLPMEADIYQKAGARVDFVGHPLLDVINIEKSREEIYQHLELNPGQKIIGILPGSRKSEIENLLPELLKAAERLQKEDRSLQFVLALASSELYSRVIEISREYSLVFKIVKDYTYELMRTADLLIMSSGTATLEATIMGTPMIVIYKTGRSSFLLSKKIMKVDFIAMPNIIAGREIVPEFIQDEANEARIFQEARKLINNPGALNIMKSNLKEIKNRLGNGGAVKRTAELVLKEGGLA